MLTLFFGIQILLLFGVPIVVGFWFKRRFGVSWILFFGGALSFVASWVVTSFVPVQGELNMLLASITQIGALYLIFRFQLRTANTEREAMMAGIGQAGIESILIAVYVALLLFQMIPLQNATDATLNSLVARSEGISEEEVEPGQLDDLRETIDDFWSTPWYGPLIQAIQSLSLLPVQAALAVLVLGALTHDHARPLLGAMALHFLSRIVPAYGGFFGGIIVWLAISLLFSGIALRFLYRLWPIIQNPTEVTLRQ